MIRFFRNIRHKLVSENKVMAYLRYAIGEILLLVIGVFIALQINVWKDDQINKKEETFYLQKLRKNLTQDTLYLSQRIAGIKSALLTNDSLSQQLNDPHLEHFSSPNLIHDLYNTFRFSPQTSTFDNLISTGKLDLITDQTFVDSLFIYYNDLNNYTKQWNESIDVYTRNIIGPYLMEFDLIENPKKKPIEYGKIPFFKNTITMRNFQLFGLQNEY
jgi:hypothetical protein